MYPGFFVWWNPVFNFPLSGAVAQAWGNQLRKTRHALDLVLERPPGFEGTLSPELREQLHDLQVQLDVLDRMTK